ncbi:MAG: DUF447 family protein [Sulfolobaceae archaeon]
MNIAEIINYIFPYDGIYEVIVSTYGVSENISPLGLIRDSDKFYFRLYSDTLTYFNLEKNPECCIQVTNEPLYFYYTLFNKKINYEKIKGFLIIPNLTTIFSKCEIVDKNSEPRRILVRPSEVLGKNLCRAYNRGESLFIDLLVHVTRLGIYSKEELEKYMKILDYEISVIERTSPRLREVINELKKEVISRFKSI